MAACGLCGAGNPDGYRFCGRCGSSLAVVACRSCGASNAAGQAFCGHCGSSIESSAAGDIGDAEVPTSPRLAGEGVASRTGQHVEEVAERKLATVLFADVVGFTSLADRTDPEVVTRMVDAAFRRLSEVVTAHGGTIDKYMGDSVMAVFGVPVAHDDDAERAVAAGLAMRELRGDLAFSIGINSGEVMAASVGRDGDLTVMGDTVNVAARLENVAAAGEVLCGGLTVELAGRRAVFRERRPVLLKGKREPVSVWEAVSIRDEYVPSVSGVPLIGRSDELAFLAAQWQRVCRDRRAHVVLLCGEAGSGKTRLLAELMRIAERDGTVVRATYPAYGAMGGPRVAADIFRQLGPARDEEVNARVRSTAGEMDPSLQSVDPAAMRREQLWAFRRLLHDKSETSPILVAIDDMHRSGEQTLQLLNELSGRIEDVPLLTVLSGRTEPADWLAGFPVATRVPLGPLTAQDSVDLAAAFACDDPIDEETTELLVGRANGNPLYLRELVTRVQSEGVTEPGIPATLHALLAARLDALDHAEKIVVQHVAVLGEAATAEKVASLGSNDASAALRSLADAGMLRQSHDGRYDAADPLLREVAYEALPRNVRGELHRRAANVSDRPEEKARHLDRAASYLSDDEVAASEAAEALADAGQALIDASRHLDGIRLLEQAVARGCRRTETLLVLARTQALSGRSDEAIATLDLIEDDPSDPSVAVERDHSKGNARLFADPEWALPRLQDAGERWLELGNSAKHAWAKANAGVAFFYSSRIDESARELERALELFEGLGDRNGIVATTSFLCLAKPTDKRVPGWLADTLEFAEQAGDRTREIGALTTLVWHEFFVSFCGAPHQVVGAVASAARMTALAEDLGAYDLAVHGWSLIAVMKRLSGQLEEAWSAVAGLDRIGKSIKQSERWLGWAATFSVTVARGAWGVAPPFPPDWTSDPVAAMAGVIVESELALSGRAPEAVDRFQRASRPNLGPIGDLGAMMHAMALVVDGHGVEALPWIDRAAEAASALEALPALDATSALRAEVTGQFSDLPDPPEVVSSLSDLLVLRAHAASGSQKARQDLQAACRALAMPGVGLGLES